MKNKVIQGNNIDILKTYPDNHFDSIVTDPPYGIEFLGKDWDSNTGAVETWAECFRVLKPGGYILAFSAARTYHNLATNIESVGFDIRDQLMWLYASGFPKAQDMGKAIQKKQGVEKSIPQSGTNAFGKKDGKFTVGGDQFGGMTATYEHDKKDEVIPTSPEAKQWAGWKTALKPAHEPIVMARKPFKGSCADNVLKHGVGAMNIDATRVPFGKDDDPNATFAGGGTKWRDAIDQSDTLTRANLEDRKAFSSDLGRYPSNVLGEVTDYQKFFYCPKVSRAERHIGFDTDNIPSIGNNNGNPMAQLPGDKNSELKKVEAQSKALGNNHPTVKPVALMKYLVKLVTPKGGKVLDPFTGSGSTGMAAVDLGYDFTGCELDPHYVEIANARITAWKNKTDLANNPLWEQLFEEA